MKWVMRPPAVLSIAYFFGGISRKSGQSKKKVIYNINQLSVQQQPHRLKLYSFIFTVGYLHIFFTVLLSDHAMFSLIV